MTHREIPFNRLFYGEKEQRYLQELLESGTMGVQSRFGRRCAELLNTQLGAAEVIITQSCTTALEMAALLVDIEPGDEVILPSFTFSSTANAFALRGARLAFVDIDPATLNIDPEQVAAAINSRTRVIAPIHYAGVSCDMDAIMALAGEHDLAVVEDAAQAIGCEYQGRPVGTRGDLATLSFHSTKNVVSGEGGALIVNNPELVDRAWIVAEKGTNRKLFYQGLVDKYSWADLGVSALPSELTCAFLLAQLESLDEINRRRLQLWNRYQEALEPLAQAGHFRLPVIPPECRHNGHIFYLMMNGSAERNALIAHLKAREITAPFHYIPLHSAPAGRRYGYEAGTLEHTDRCSARLLRLPSWVGLEQSAEHVIEAIFDFFDSSNSSLPG
ncbi:dTDP-4-amino-4,6-dideoxygalactose transaminase [Elongatibacter sediminis]|uniref:dTDP-4-amino-4,6-dideoxygalactose transaminase n=1 Tax=Elongatibacter sediminis TaxID=3119006 RepID=A0AAW9RIL0_9GAMM